MDKELVKRVFAYARKYGKAVYAVVSNMSIAVERRDFLQQTSCFVCNLQEAGILFSDDYSEKTPAEMEELLRLKVRSARIPRMIVTMGEQGAVYAEMDGERHLPRHPCGGAGHHRGRRRLFCRGYHRTYLRQDAGSVLRHRQPVGSLRHLHQQQRLPPVPAGGVRAGRHCDGMRCRE